MSPFRNRHALATLLVGGVLAGTLVTQAPAAEIGFFEALFGGGRPAQQAYQPSEAAPDAGAVRHRRSRRATRPRTRYAALPAAEPLRVRISDRQKPIDTKGGAVAALMKDPTLLPGDIVVLNTGARVFTGDPDAAHTLRDFEPVDRSGYVDAATRKRLAALMAPASALPADQAKRFLAQLKSAPRVPASLVPQQASMRIITPWKTAP